MEKLKNKNILYCDKDGNFSAHSMEEILASRTNSWKGWKCSAGISNLHITADGNIFSGTCRVGGLLGNVYDHGVQLPQQWITCTKEWCMCGAEMELFKFRSDHTQKVELAELTNFSNARVSPQWVGPANLNRSKYFPLTITWDIGRRCNYQCSYCPPSTSNTFEVYKSFGSLKYAAEMLMRDFCKESKAQWIFTGGEPTLNPSFLDLLDLLKLNGHLIITQSNGSRDSSYYQDLIRRSAIGFSVHFEQYNKKKFLEVCTAITDFKKQMQDNEKNHFSIRFMVAPGDYSKAIDLKNELLSIENFSEINAMNFAPLYQKYDGDQLMSYTSDELEAIEKNS